MNNANYLILSQSRLSSCRAGRRQKVLINNLDSQVIKRAPWKTQVITGIHAIPDSSHGPLGWVQTWLGISHLWRHFWILEQLCLFQTNVIFLCRVRLGTTRVVIGESCCYCYFINNSWRYSSNQLQTSSSLHCVVVFGNMYRSRGIKSNFAVIFD